MSDPLDLDAIEEDGTPMSFTFGGTEFTLTGDPEVKAWEYLAKGDAQMCLWLLLGQEQYEVMDALDAKMTAARFSTLMERYQLHLGIGPGKSSGPSGSSKRTARR